ncbi:MAG: hypothetical protein ACHQDE_01355 [Acidimicrobiia bacterium]
MQRRKLLAMAGALSVTAFATTVGLGANFGLFGITEPNSSIGRLDSSQPGVAVGVRVGSVLRSGTEPAPRSGTEPAPRSGTEPAITASPPAPTPGDRSEPDD